MAMSESVVKRIPSFDLGRGGEDQGQGDFSPGFLNLSIGFFSPLHNMPVVFQAFDLAAWQHLQLKLHDFPTCGLTFFGTLCWLVRAHLENRRDLDATSSGCGRFLTG